MADTVLVLLERVLDQKDKFKLLQDNKELKNMISHFEKSMPQSLGMSGIELGRITGIQFNKWDEFLNLPPIQEFISEQSGYMIESASRAALVNLGDADKSVDVQKVKAFADLKKNSGTSSRKPFNIYMLPAEVIKYKTALIEIKQYIETEEEPTTEGVLKLVAKVITNAN